MNEHSNPMNSHWSVAAELARKGTPFVVVTLVQVRGHAPQEPGAKMIVTAEGLHWGTVGGGKVEAKAIALASSRLSVSPPELLTWNLQRDVGMTCGGEVQVLFETHHARAWTIHLFGAGHIAQAITRLLGTLDCRVICTDWRPEWIDKLPSGVERVLLDQAPGLEEARTMISNLPTDGYFVIMTQGHATDFPIAQAVIESRPAARYLGVIGSDVKALKIRAELKALGFSEERIGRLHCPMGLPLGGNDPAEIALSIAAQLVQVRDAE